MPAEASASSGQGGAPALAHARGARRAAWTRAARPWLLLAPALAVLAVLLLWPLVRVVLLSFQNHGLRQINTGESDYTGLDNYREILGDPFLWKTVLPNTVFFAAACVFLTLLVGTLVALLLARLGRTWRVVCSTVIMMAWAMPAVTGTYVWIWIFDPLNGVVSGGLDAAGAIEPRETNWFTDRWSFYAIATLNVVHHGFPFVAVTLYAALLTIPRELPEAALMDGANAWQRFWRITVPTIRPVFAVVTILSTIWDFKVFAQVYLMPGGSGANPEVLNLGVWSYIQSFSRNEYGMGSAIAVLLTLLLLALTVGYVKALAGEGEEP
ncbi:N,N'-diacetylchitobiose transport system permease protein [Streptomyces zhaozhouensis]|uniref:N,N'-diacetylchitobiose transport system permease protein n=1 Tax=Streptomyces zhaozhouensis TaxID=1300267 RepID=A0A286DJ52_9ACTN|nr:sugar ABC transporter permease [Streptomyces zhaozhouensis]SOD58524.1 N,N'-diacetylchitobiose transport system permease protein [Streptomyces zhaozhouensis]